jgi:hypothetical protein
MLKSFVYDIRNKTFLMEYKTMSKINADELIEAARRDDGTGFCIECGNEQSGCEPDARKYECDCCGAHAVYGAEELILMGYGS